MKGYRVSIMMKSTESNFMEYCEMNYVSRGGTGLSVAIKIMINKWQLGIIKHLSTNKCYLYLTTGQLIEGYLAISHLNKDIDTCNSTWHGPDVGVPVWDNSIDRKFVR